MRLFVILSRVPYPLDKGDKLRAYHQLVELSKNHKICLVCLAEEPPQSNAMAELEQFCAEVHFISLKKSIRVLRLARAVFSRKPFQVHYYYQSSAHKQVLGILNKFDPEHIYAQLVRTTEYVKNLHHVPKTLDYMDALSKGMQRRIKKAKWPLSAMLREESKRLVQYENLIFDYFEFHTIITSQDRDWIYHSRRESIRVVANGVDFEFYQPKKTEKKYDIVFTGNMNYSPNIEAALYLVNEILPLVLKQRPETKVLIAGATPHQKVQKLASPNVSISGWMDDIRTAYYDSTLFVAPMQIGTGLQNKLLETMSIGVPCITSELANKALGATHMSNIIVCSKQEDYAAQILALLQDETQRELLRKNALDFVQSKYDWSAATQNLLSILETKQKV